MIFQASMILFHVNLQGWISFPFPNFPSFSLSFFRPMALELLPIHLVARQCVWWRTTSGLADGLGPLGGRVAGWTPWDTRINRTIEQCWLVETTSWFLIILAFGFWFEAGLQESWYCAITWRLGRICECHTDWLLREMIVMCEWEHWGPRLSRGDFRLLAHFAGFGGFGPRRCYNWHIKVGLVHKQ